MGILNNMWETKSFGKRILADFYLDKAKEKGLQTFLTKTENKYNVFLSTSSLEASKIFKIKSAGLKAKESTKEDLNYFLEQFKSSPESLKKPAVYEFYKELKRLEKSKNVIKFTLKGSNQTYFMRRIGNLLESSIGYTLECTGDAYGMPMWNKVALNTLELCV